MSSIWTSEEVFFNGDDYFKSLLRDIDQAREYITVEVYIFKDDVLGLEIAQHLLDAQNRGVRVQVIVDGLGSYQFQNRFSHLLADSGMSVKLYNPLPFLHPFYGKLSTYRKFQIFVTRALRLNKRNHRKIITLDYHIMYTGSFNFSVEHTQLSHEKAWQDMGVRVTGPAVNYAVLNFKRSWKLRDYFRFKKQMIGVQRIKWRQSPLRLSHTLFMKRFFYENFVRRINRAHSRIWFTSPYFIPKRRVIKALGRAARRGVDVRLLVSSKSDVKLFRTLQFFYFPYLIKAGVKVFQYTDTVLHAKNYIIDDWMTIGSTNLNHRSMLHDMEVDLVIQEKRNLILIEEHFKHCSEAQPLITAELMKARPFKDRLLSQLFFIFRYWF